MPKLSDLFTTIVTAFRAGSVKPRWGGAILCDIISACGVSASSGLKIEQVSMKFADYYLFACSRVRNSGLALVLTIALVLSPLTMLPSFANNFLNQREYWNSQSHTSTDNGYRIGVDSNVRFKSKPSGFFKAERVGQEPGKGSVLIWNDCNPKRYSGKLIHSVTLSL